MKFSAILATFFLFRLLLVSSQCNFATQGVKSRDPATCQVTSCYQGWFVIDDSEVQAYVCYNCGSYGVYKGNALIPDNFETNPSGVCSPFTPGMYVPDWSGDSDLVEVPCPNGYYCIPKYMTTPTLCDKPGTYSDNVANIATGSSSDCLPITTAGIPNCNVYADQLGTTCIAAAAGYFLGSPPNQTIICPEYTNSHDFNQNECQPCHLFFGEYCSMCSPTGCVTCQVKYFLDPVENICKIFDQRNISRFCQYAAGPNPDDCQECEWGQFRMMELDSSVTPPARQKIGNCVCMTGYGERSNLKPPNYECSWCGGNALNCTFDANGLATATCIEGYFFDGISCAQTITQVQPLTAPQTQTTNLTEISASYVVGNNTNSQQELTKPSQTQISINSNNITQLDMSHTSQSFSLTKITLLVFIFHLFFVF